MTTPTLAELRAQTDDEVTALACDSHSTVRGVLDTLAAERAAADARIAELQARCELARERMEGEKSSSAGEQSSDG